LIIDNKRNKKYTLIKLKNESKNMQKKKIRYSFKFASIISPGSIQNTTLLTSSYSNRIFIKQSYVLLT